jgi:hypothetical protein
MRALLFILVFSIFIPGCSGSDVSEDRLLEYLADESNGLTKSVTKDAIKTEVAYKPTDLLVKQDLAGTSQTGLIDSTRKKYGRHLYFTLRLSANDRELLEAIDGEMYSDLLQTLSFRMTEFVNLTTSRQDTIRVADFVLNRSFGMSSATELLFVFDRQKANGAAWVQFNLNECGIGVGNQRFRFLMKDIEYIPQINFETIK